MECEPVPAMELPNEIWIKILTNLSHRHLLQLSLVSKHFNRLIFTFMSHRFLLSLELDRRDGPPVGVNDMVPERSYKHLRIKSHKDVDSLMTVIEHLAPNLQSLEFSAEIPGFCLGSLDFPVLIQIIKLCTRLNKLCIKVKVENIEALDPMPIFPGIISFGLDTENQNSFEKAFLPCIPNVTELEIALRQSEIHMVEQMAPRLKVLDVQLHQVALTKFLQLQMPILEQLEARPDWGEPYPHGDMFVNKAWEHFLIGCKKLEKAVLSFRNLTNESRVPFRPIANGLPLVKKLQLCQYKMDDFYELQKMKHLKELTLTGCWIGSSGYQWNGPIRQSLPTVEKFASHNSRYDIKLDRMLAQFPNLQSFRLSADFLGGYDDLEFYADSVPRLKEFTFASDRALSDVIHLLPDLLSLEKIVLSSYTFAKTNFRLLKKVIVLPLLKSLVVETTRTEIPADIAKAVAAANPACTLELNGARVEPPPVARRSRKKRKQPGPAVAI